MLNLFKFMNLVFLKLYFANQFFQTKKEIYQLGLLIHPLHSNISKQNKQSLE